MIEHYKNKSLTNIEGEEWRLILEYEDLYSISSLGRIKSLSSDRVNIRKGGGSYKSKKQEQILAQKKHNRGYKMICLTKDKKKKYTTIHRLVAEAFIPNPESKRTVNHKNGIKWDNRVENLEWATDSENGIHSFRELNRRTVPTYLGKFGKNHNRSKPILQFDLDGNLIKEWENAQQAKRELRFSCTNISLACNKRHGHNQYNNFLWKFSSDPNVLINAAKKSTVKKNRQLINNQIECLN